MDRTGGAQIGWFHASWPFAKLYAGPGVIKLKVRFSEEYTFLQNQVIEIEKVGSIPILTQGIRIHHVNPDYPEKIIFWCIGNADNLLREIRSQGFHPQATAAAKPQRQGFPVRWQAIVFAIAAWNILLFVDMGGNPVASGRKPGPLTLLALLVFFIGSIAVLQSSRIQSLVLKPGRDVKEIKHVLNLVALITGFMSLIFSMFVFRDLFT